MKPVIWCFIPSINAVTLLIKVDLILWMKVGGGLLEELIVGLEF